MADADETALINFLQTANWDSIIADPETRTFCVEIKKRADALSGEVDLSSATRIKLVVVGDGAVGKTSLLISYATDKFPTDYVPTVFENYTAQMKTNDRTILLHLWDTAGQEDYDRLRPLSYPGADLILLCFSLCSHSSYESIKIKWFPEVRHHIPDVPYFLVGTKLDLKNELIKNFNPEFELVNEEEGQALKNEINAVKYCEISAKTRMGLEGLFQDCVSTVLEIRRHALGEVPPEQAPASAAASNQQNKNPQKNEKCILQ